MVRLTKHKHPARLRGVLGGGERAGMIYDCDLYVAALPAMRDAARRDDPTSR